MSRTLDPIAAQLRAERDRLDLSLTDAAARVHLPAVAHDLAKPDTRRPPQPPSKPPREPRAPQHPQPSRPDPTPRPKSRPGAVADMGTTRPPNPRPASPEAPKPRPPVRPAPPPPPPSKSLSSCPPGGAAVDDRRPAWLARIPEPVLLGLASNAVVVGLIAMAFGAGAR